MTNMKPFLGGVAVGAVALMILGFGVLGWKFDSKAQAMAQEAAKTAMMKALIPVCIAQFRADPEASKHLTALRAEEYSYPRTELVRLGGWATLPGQSEPASGLAHACANALIAQKQ